VRTLAAGRYAPGTHEASWDGRDAAGRPVASGAYYGRLSAEGVTETRRLAIVR
jgi:flagellar hook assembly protein FlgD